MSLLSSSSGVLVDTASVSSEVSRHSDSASNRTTLEFLDHGFFIIIASNRCELVNFVDIVLGRNEAVIMRVAIFALDDRRAFKTIVMTSGSVDRAGLISDFIIMHELVGRDSFTTVATIVFH